ncbi:MAG TPA: response regulator transcription factor [Nocardioidaceae bacterium]|jgi:DNA-binding NarL/FixJ family response regulator|nr:response regulator transcription factor [Nocardioidaceae bacterium]
MSLVVCDDHEMFLRALVEALDAVGHRVLASTADPEELPVLVARHRPRLVLLDVSIPGSDGIELAHRLRDRHAGTAIVLLTGNTEERVRQAYDAGGVDGLVSKAAGLRALDTALQRVLAGERVVVGWTSHAGPPRRTALDQLTDRERQVLMLLADGASTAAMAERLGVSVNTVRSHVRNVLQKLGVHHRGKAAHAAVELGLAAG